MPGAEWVAPLVAVVVLNWNRPGDTEECVQSVLQSAYPNLLPIIVDNGSTDGSADRLAARFPECRLMRNPHNLGFAEGNNVGIREGISAGAEYVLLLNNDAKIDRNAVGKMAEILVSDPSIGVVGGSIYLWDQPESVWCFGGKVDPVAAMPYHILNSGTPGDPKVAAIDVDYACGCALMGRSEVFDRVGLLDHDYFLLFEDTDFCARVRDAGYRVVVAVEAKVWHKASTSFGGTESSKYLYYFHRNNLLYVRKRMKGARRLRAYAEVLRRQAHYVWQLYRRGKPEAPGHRHAITRAILDFVLGRWGEDPRQCV